MRKLHRNILLAAAALGLAPAFGASAAVSIALAANGVTHTGNSITVPAGGTFSVATEMINTAPSTGANTTTDVVVGVTYELQQKSGNTLSAFSLTSRDLTTGAGARPFSDPNNPNYNVSSAGNPNPFTTPVPLTPDNGFDLGAGLANQSSGITGNYPSGTGAFNPALLATYTVAVAPNALGTYVLSVKYLGAPFGYTYPTGPGTFDDTTLSPVPGNPSGIAQDFTVNVVAAPEPSSLLMVGLGTGAMTLLRRRRQNACSL